MAMHTHTLACKYISNKPDITSASKFPFALWFRKKNPRGFSATPQINYIVITQLLFSSENMAGAFHPYLHP